MFVGMVFHASDCSCLGEVCFEFIVSSAPRPAQNGIAAETGATKLHGPSALSIVLPLGEFLFLESWGGVGGSVAVIFFSCVDYSVHQEIRRCLIVGSGPWSIWIGFGYAEWQQLPGSQVNILPVSCYWRPFSAIACSGLSLALLLTKLAFCH